MALTWYSSGGQPGDALGVDGDLTWDYTNRITWGPKGRVNSGSWAGTAYSNIGPTGPAQLSGVGAPSSTYGQNGNGYTDQATGLTYYKSSNAWAQVGSVRGPQGQDGPSSLGALAAAYGPAPGSGSITTSATATAMPFGNSGYIQKYTPVFGSSFLGGYVRHTATVAVTFSLVNTTTNAPVYTQSVAANTFARMGIFDVGTYPMVANNDYVWMVSTAASATFAAEMYPVYAMPASGPTQMVSYYPALTNDTAANISSTAISLGLFGSTQASLLGPPRQAGLYTAQATLTATGATATTATATLTFYSQPNAGGTVTELGTYPLTADGVTRTIIAPRLNDSSLLSTANRYYWQVSSTATITARVYLQVVAFV